MRSTLLTLCLLAAAPALAAQPVAQAEGRDLAAWEALEVQDLDGDAAIAAYRDFIVRYPGSALAAVAWGRLQRWGATSTWSDDPEAAEALVWAERAWRGREVRPAATEVARLELTPGVPATELAPVGPAASAASDEPASDEAVPVREAPTT